MGTVSSSAATELPRRPRKELLIRRAPKTIPHSGNSIELPGENARYRCTSAGSDYHSEVAAADNSAPRTIKLIRRSILLVPYPRHDPITPTKGSSPRVVTPIRTKQKERLATARKTQEALPMYCLSERPVCRKLFVSPLLVPSSVKGETDDVPEDWLL